MPSLAHDEEAVAAHGGGVRRRAAQRVGGADAKRHARRSAEPSTAAFGTSRPGPARRVHRFGAPREHRLVLCGWMLYEDGPPEAIEAVVGDQDNGRPRSAERRPDLPDSHPDVPGAGDRRVQHLAAGRRSSRSRATTSSRCVPSRTAARCSHCAPCACASEHGVVHAPPVAAAGRRPAPLSLESPSRRRGPSREPSRPRPRTARCPAPAQRPRCSIRSSARPLTPPARTAGARRTPSPACAR